MCQRPSAQSIRWEVDAFEADSVLIAERIPLSRYRTASNPGSYIGFRAVGDYLYVDFSIEPVGAASVFRQGDRVKLKLTNGSIIELAGAQPYTVAGTGDGSPSRAASLVWGLRLYLPLYDTELDLLCDHPITMVQVTTDSDRLTGQVKERHARRVLELARAVRAAWAKTAR
jgi:hypothetical protein